MSATYLKHQDQLSCLVPSENAQKEGWVVTSHEKTLCDCTVQKIAIEFQVENKRLREENEQLKADIREIQMGMDL